jgi:hypothetical protein
VIEGTRLAQIRKTLSQRAFTEALVGEFADGLVVERPGVEIVRPPAPNFGQLDARELRV